MQTLSECDLDEETVVVDPAALAPHIACTRARELPEVQRGCDRLLADGESPSVVAAIADNAERELTAVWRVRPKTEWEGLQAERAGVRLEITRCARGLRVQVRPRTAN